MKKILVPTDFSKSSHNTLSYAVQLAKHVEAEIFLLHVYTLPVLVDGAMLMTTEEYILEDALHNLETLKEPFRESKGVKITHVAIAGIPAETIDSYAEKNQIDLIVAGTQGVSYFQERVLGSTASELIRKTKIPTMVIDKKVKFRVPKKIVLAVDFSETNDTVVLKMLKELAAKFKSHICVLNIFSEETLIPSYGEIAESFRLERTLKHTYHTFFEVKHHDVVFGINDFVKSHHIDMVALISRKHSIIGRLFREPITQAMTFHSIIPLLVLHE